MIYVTISNDLKDADMNTLLEHGPLPLQVVFVAMLQVFPERLLTVQVTALPNLTYGQKTEDTETCEVTYEKTLQNSFLKFKYQFTA